MLGLIYLECLIFNQFMVSIFASLCLSESSSASCLLPIPLINVIILSNSILGFCTTINVHHTPLLIPSELVTMFIYCCQNLMIRILNPIIRIDSQGKGFVYRQRIPFSWWILWFSCESYDLIRSFMESCDLSDPFERELVNNYSWEVNINVLKFLLAFFF